MSIQIKVFISGISKSNIFLYKIFFFFKQKRKQREDEGGEEEAEEEEEEEVKFGFEQKKVPASVFEKNVPIEKK